MHDIDDKTPVGIVDSFLSVWLTDIVDQIVLLTKNL